ncbi:ankyrin repeat domain-containing protein [Carboxylicivirga sp. N1Y90]|uniref:ankyrin repeat domain-containing protein n=1 Tax=Carboxylicivirga fragile TaxID=3417571 RepID=UPI003D33F3D5|nr:ankyrin repeat domain-containing protein [Marinilabiliaceae bacterium N1Y90]
MKTKISFTIIFTLVMVLLNASCKNTSGDSQKGNTNIQKPKVDIHAAAFMGDVNSMKQHIKVGSDLNVKDQYGSTPLSIAITFNRTDVANVLINGGADLSIKSADGSTALHTAAFFGRKEIVSSLINKGANKQATNNYGATPYQSVAGPFSDVKPIYEQLNKDLGSLGLRLDYDRLEKVRPIIADMLK